MKTLFAEALIRAMGWALVHSMWQGAVLAVLLLFLLQKLRAARQRYYAAFAALSLLFCVSLCTFAYLYAPEAAHIVSDTPEVILQESTHAATWTWAATDPGYLTLVSDWLENNYPVIVAVWLLGFGFFLFQLLGAYFFLQQLRTQGAHLAETHWQQTLQRLSSHMQLARPVKLLESALVHAPMTLGYFKPIILLPIGMINRLSVAEVEAILAHELAHILRQDWLFNLLQAFMEAVFYYHPAVWWISGIIRKEREHCCDDTAIRLTGNRLIYAKALVQVQEMAKKSAQPALALGMQGNAIRLRRKTPLLDRIRRVLNQSQPKSQIMEKMIATGALLILLTLYSIHTNTPQALAHALQSMEITPTNWFTAEQSEPTLADTVPPPSKGIQRIVREDEKQKVEMDLKDGTITRLMIDGKEIPASEFDQYNDLKNEVWEDAAPPAPPAPPEMPAFPDLPFPPAAPNGMMGGYERVFTEKDPNGNTIIRLERPDGPMEIKVSDGKVYINGAALKEGATLEIATEHAWPEAPEMPEMVELQELAELQEMQELPELMEFPNYQMDAKQLAEFNAEMDRMRKELKKDQKSFEKERRRMQKDHKQEFERIQKEHLRIQRESIRAQNEAVRAQQEAERSIENARSEVTRAKLLVERDRQRTVIDRENTLKDGRIQEQIQRALLTDALITNPDKYNMRLSTIEMRVNGKIQDESIKKKYLEYHKSISGRTLKNAESIQIEKN
jgi:beta-lactamase regulating signal transducer with metallopeptidase domain